MREGRDHACVGRPRPTSLSITERPPKGRATMLVFLRAGLRARSRRPTVGRGCLKKVELLVAAVVAVSTFPVRASSQAGERVRLSTNPRARGGGGGQSQRREAARERTSTSWVRRLFSNCRRSAKRANHSAGRGENWQQSARRMTLPRIVDRSAAAGKAPGAGKAAAHNGAWSGCSSICMLRPTKRSICRRLP